MSVIKNIRIDYESFEGVNDERVIKEWVADEYDESQLLAVNTPDDQIVLMSGTQKSKKGSNRQIGDRPKTLKTFRLDTGLAEQLEHESKESGKSQVDILESALRQYFQ